MHRRAMRRSLHRRWMDTKPTKFVGLVSLARMGERANPPCHCVTNGDPLLTAMALTTAERQARYRQRLKEAAQGVTVDMIDQVVKLSWEQARRSDPDLPNWADYTASLAGKGGARAWERNVRELGWMLDTADEAEIKAAFGADADAVFRVAQVVRAMMLPPGRR